MIWEGFWNLKLEDAYFICIKFYVSAVDGKQTVPQAEIDKHLEMGRLMLSKGQLQDALSHYHAAVGKLYYYLLFNNVVI